MQPAEIQPFDLPAAWKATDFPSTDSFSIDLTPHHLTAFEAALRSLKAAGMGHDAVTAADFPLSPIAEEVAGWQREVSRGRGFVMLRGLPLDRYDPDDLKLFYLGLGAHFGRPVSQSNMGELVGEVVNIGDKDPRERAYRNSLELELHTDRCDILAMLCERPAIRGGESAYASALTIHNIMLEERPDLLAHLYRGYFHHRFGEQPPGEAPVTTERIPIFSVTDGVPSVICIRGYIDLAVEEGHVTLTPGEREALDVMEEVANRGDVRLEFTMQPGEIIFTNNCLLLHTRRAFEDSPEADLRRRLLRLWLREDARPMAPGVLLHKGRDGIAKLAGKGTYYSAA